MARLSSSSTMNARPIQSGPSLAPSASVDDRNFWGMTVKPGESKKVKFNGDRLCVTQATLGRRSKDVPKRNGRSCLYMKKGRKRPLCVCSLRSRNLEMWVLDLLYKSPCNISFINHGCYSIHLVGYSYFLPTSPSSSPIATTYIVEEETLQEPVIENDGHGHQTISHNECETLEDDQENRVGETASIFPDNDHQNITTTKECAGKDSPNKNVNESLVIALEIPNKKKRKMNKVEAQSASDTTKVLEELLKEPVTENGDHAPESISINESDTLGGEKNRVKEVDLVLSEDDKLNISTNILEIEQCATKDGGDEEHPHIRLESEKNIHESLVEIPKKTRKNKKIAGESVGLSETEQIVQPPKKKRKDKDMLGYEAEKFSDTTNGVEELLKEPVTENGSHSHENTPVNESEALGAEENRVGERVSVFPEDINVNILTIVREIEESAAKDVPDEEHHHIPSESEKNAYESSEISKKKRKKGKKIERESASLPEAEEIVQSPRSRRKSKRVAGNEAEKSRFGVGGENPTSLNSRQADTEEILQPTPLSIYVPTPKGMKETPSDRLITNDEHQVSFAGTHGAASWSRDFVLGLNARGKDRAATKNGEDPKPNVIDEHDLRFEMFHH